jgi:16S rRNA (cytosine1402-N4)-methyltransferase
MHEPVLLEAILDYLSPRKGDLLLDATAGYGGHAQAILDMTKNYKGSVLVDRDQMAIDHLWARFAGKQVAIIHNDFYLATKQLVEQAAQFDLIVADLGVSSPHLNMASRGFSFSDEGPLDMRMDQRQALTAEDIVNNWSPEQLTEIIWQYGQEPHARRIAKNIVANRPLFTTLELAAIIARASAKRRRGKHPATRTFQALRIVVNDELKLLAASLPLWVQLLRPDGRLGIISFHSLEDRIVKQFFADYGGNTYDAVLKILTKKPIVASRQEIVLNPRSRSAKLRVAVKIKTTERTSDAH